MASQSRRPSKKLLGCHAVHDAVFRDSRTSCRSDAKRQKLELARSVGIRADRDLHANVSSKCEERSIKVLTVRISIDFNSPVLFSGTLEYPPPVTLQPKAEVEDATAGMSQDVDGGISKSSEVALGLVLSDA